MLFSYKPTTPIPFIEYLLYLFMQLIYFDLYLLDWGEYFTEYSSGVVYTYFSILKSKPFFLFVYYLFILSIYLLIYLFIYCCYYLIIIIIIIYHYFFTFIIYMYMCVHIHNFFFYLSMLVR